ncbi:DNA internalization-related competence protein ComEC/Rec2 [Shewanella sp. TC10]|uniref:DNA internalization-related competence protein ComEC/Rec2 n=1 Tax=Shewanella sp. TC10 TaxID=1419739 RepID=UPI001892B8C4|nr:DNA internalization-related competence protein ComEC/Rec2 [Shewanella sp. TC10]
MLFSNILPSLLPIWMASIILIVVLSTFKKWPFISGTLSGVLLVSFCFNSLFSSHESEIPVQKQFKAEIVSLVSTNSDWISFDIRLISEHKAFYQSNYRLTWQHPPEVKVGQVWLFTARMKPITSPLNQGGFNQQKYLLSRHIVAKGRVKQAKLLHYEAPIRQIIIDKMTPILHSLSNGSVLRALLFGDKSALTPQQWQQLRQTGTGHLVAISGLHLSVVFGLFWFLSRFGLQRILPTESRRNVLMAMVFAVLMTAGYGYLAGFAISTQRAFVMLLMLVVLTMVNQYSSPWQRLMWALFAVLIIDPFASLSAGFWLSFSALVIILFTLEYSEANSRSINEVIEFNDTGANDAGTNDTEFNNDEVNNDEVNAAKGIDTQDIDTHDNQTQDNEKSIHQVDPSLANNWSYIHLFKMKSRNYFWQLVIYFQRFWSIQWRLAVGLGLIQAVLFGTVSINSIWVNLLMVPWFSILVIPLSIIALVLILLMMLLPLSDEIMVGIGTQLMTVANFTLEGFQLLISQSNHWPVALIYLPDRLIICLMMFVFGLFLLKWTGNIQWRLCAGLLCLPFFMYLTNNLINEENNDLPTNWQAHILDVGQGTAVLIQQGNRGILYDTGAAYGENFSYAERVIIPTLKAKGVSQLDYIIISHDDNDHAGGLSTLLAQYPNSTLISDTHEHHFNLSKVKEPIVNPCSKRQFIWQGLKVDLAVNSKAENDNNRSCIAYISDDKHQLLLAGDIEKQSEQYFIENNSLTKADILLAPHHGSRTSSTAAFIDEVSPKQVIFTAGFANQYGFPKDDVVNRYKIRGIETLVSGRSGQISIDFKPSNYVIRQYRTDIAPFWYNKLFRFGEKVKAE